MAHITDQNSDVVGWDQFKEVMMWKAKKIRNEKHLDKKADKKADKKITNNEL